MGPPAVNFAKGNGAQCPHLLCLRPVPAGVLARSLIAEVQRGDGDATSTTRGAWQAL